MNYSKLIGIPFQYGGRGPDSFDCYGLLMHLYLQNGIELPDYNKVSDASTIAAMMTSALPLWKRCGLKPGVALMFKLPMTTHVGYYLGNDRFIHTWERSGGVLIERLSVWKRRLLGAYEYVGK